MVLRRWESEKRLGFIKRVDKGLIHRERLESCRFERKPFIRSEQGLTLETSAF